jgi:hypothetical protein
VHRINLPSRKRGRRSKKESEEDQLFILNLIKSPTQLNQTTRTIDSDNEVVCVHNQNICGGRESQKKWEEEKRVIPNSIEMISPQLIEANAAEANKVNVHNIKATYCNLCNINFISKPGLTMHNRMKHRGDEFKQNSYCSLCDRSFSSAFGLQIHTTVMHKKGASSN